MFKSKHKVKKFMLCFHDFSTNNRHKDVFVELSTRTQDTWQDIFVNFNRGMHCTTFMKEALGINTGTWKLIHIEDMDGIVKVDYNEAK